MSGKDNTDVCGKQIIFRDTYGINCSLFRCQLPREHTGKHRQEGMDDEKIHLFVLEWQVASNELPCPICHSEGEKDEM